MTRKEAALRESISDIQNSSSDISTPTRRRGLSRIMYIENKSGGLIGSARVGRVTFTRTGKTLYYSDQSFQSLKGAGYKSNFVDIETGDSYWISGPKKNGGDRLYGERLPIEIDEDVREEYWLDIRGLPDRVSDSDAQL
jgi:hypothetical protein